MVYRCDACRLPLNSKWQYDQHLLGKAHAKRLKKIAEDPSEAKLPTINFVPAGGNFNSMAQSAPTAGGNFNATAQSGPTAIPKSKPPSKKSTRAEEVNNVHAPLFCDICLIQLNSKDQAFIHYSGSKHLRKLNMSQQLAAAGTGIAEVTPKPAPTQTGGYHFCQFCNVQLNSALQLSVHREGAKHKRNVEGKKRQAEPWQGQTTPAKRQAMDSSNNGSYGDQSQMAEQWQGQSTPAKRPGMDSSNVSYGNQSQMAEQWQGQSTPANRPAMGSSNNGSYGDQSQMAEQWQGQSAPASRQAMDSSNNGSYGNQSQIAPYQEAYQTAPNNCNNMMNSMMPPPTSGM